MNLRYFLQINRNLLIIKTIIFISFCVLASVVFASKQKADEELAQLLGNINTMQATFKQFTINNRGVQLGQETVGSMVLERPGKFRWEVTLPNKQLIIINKDKLLLYDIDLAQVTKRKMDYKKLGNPAMLLSGNTETLKQVFKIVKLKSLDEKNIWFELRPKGKNSTNNGYQWVRLGFSAGQLSKMRVFDNFDQQSEIQFKNIVVNTKVSSDKFNFVVPSKVDVVDES